MLTAEDCERSWRGISALRARGADGTAALDVSERGFWISFRAIILAAPALVVQLALARRGFGLSGPLFGHPPLALAIAAGMIARFAALPALMLPVARRFGLGARYVPFVVATNWVEVFGLLLMALPGTLLLLGWAAPALATFYGVAFMAVLLHFRWTVAATTLGLAGRDAALLVGAGLGLDAGLAFLVGSTLQAIVG